MIPTQQSNAYAHKETHGFGLAILWNQRIQDARDVTVCRCGHQGVSHGYGEDGGSTWPDGSHIGRGACGMASCTCREFEDRARPDHAKEAA